MDNNIFLQSNDIYLKPLSTDEINDSYISWLNNKEVCKYNSHHRFPNTLEKTNTHVKNSNNSNTDIILAIYSNISNKHIGNISFTNINYIDSNVELSILIGDLDFHSKNIGYQACTLMINHGFNTLNLHRIYCGTSKDNIPMQKLAIKLDMNLEGTSKEALFKNGQYIDILHYAIMN
jgi:RimJ/RimL family protein N-acetyltransferase